jgi:hypothetical protein
MNEEKIRISGMDRKKSLEFAFDYAKSIKLFDTDERIESVLKRLWNGQL